MSPRGDSFREPSGLRGGRQPFGGTRGPQHDDDVLAAREGKRPYGAVSSGPPKERSLTDRIRPWSSITKGFLFRTYITIWREWYQASSQGSSPYRIVAALVVCASPIASVHARRLLDESGLRPDAGFWRFVPSGDLPYPLGSCAASWIVSDDGSLRRLYGVGSVWSGGPRTDEYQGVDTSPRTT